jgi:hypothetical protein
MLPLAHAAHWYHAVLYLLPVLLIGGALWWSGRRDAGERAERPPPPQDRSDQD